MKVKELIEYLQTIDPELDVVMSSDAEGNSYSHLDGFDDNNVFIPGHPQAWGRGEIKVHHLTDELIKQGFTDEDLHEGPLPEHGGQCVVLWPV